MIFGGIIALEAESIYLAVAAILKKKAPVRVTPTLGGGRGSATTTSTSTATPSQWILNTVPGTTQSEFETFIQTLPDKGIGRRIVYDTADHQWYAGSMTLDEAKIVSRVPIVDQIVSNEVRRDTWEASSGSSLRTEALRKRDPEFDIYERPGAEKHLRAISMAKSITWNIDNVMSEEFTFESEPGHDTFIYLIDKGVDTTHYVSFFPTVGQYKLWNCLCLI